MARPKKLDALQMPVGTRCWYCGRVLYEYCEDGNLCGMGTVDHVIPLRQGGPNIPDNLVWACQSCNSQKGGRTPEQYRWWLYSTGRRSGLSFYGEEHPSALHPADALLLDQLAPEAERRSMLKTIQELARAKTFQPTKRS